MSEILTSPSPHAKNLVIKWPLKSARTAGKQTIDKPVQVHQHIVGLILYQKYLESSIKFLY